MALESYVRERMREKDILLMTHIVLGYPCFEDCYRIVEAMVEAGVDLMDLQIPFSEPIADGPVILRASQRALENGTTVQACLNFAQEVARRFDIAFLLMSYYNIPFKYGIPSFASSMAKIGLEGTIIPDLPPEEAQGYLEVLKKHQLAPIFIFSPTTSETRMQYIASFASGFIYCMARKGVTGANTNFSEDLAGYLGRCRKATSLPLALGFGVREKCDIDYLKGKVDIAVIGTQTIRVAEKRGIGSVGDFIRSLR
jgi:tryptophan synthase alpha chain